MPQNDFVPWGTGPGANVYATASYIAMAARQTGVVDGEADPTLANNSWRQGTVLASAVGAYILSQGYDALDNGDLATLTNNFKAALITGTAAAPTGKGLTSFKTAGPGSWIVPSKAAGASLDVFYVYATCVGGGGGGSGNSTSGVTAGAGGGAGGTAAGWVAVTPGQVINFVVGTGGAGSPYQNAATAGGTSTIGSYLQATGGAGAGNATATAGGAGGIGSGSACQVALSGGNGNDGNQFTVNSSGGVGGASSLGGGGRAATSYIASVSNGQAPGSGGGGIYSAVATSNGGNGASGYVSFQY